MKIKLFTVAMGIVLTATAFKASAQKAYTEGFVTYNMDMRGQAVEAKHYFRADSSAIAFSAGPANIKVLSDSKQTFMAILVDVSIASMKKAAVMSPAEIEEAVAKMPTLTFAPGTETKVISGFNCKKVVATDTKTSKTYDVWVTNDISVPATAFSKYYAGAGGFPVQFASFQDGQTSQVTVKSVTEGKAAAGTFGIPGDFERITMDDLKSLGGGM
ncbi:DUF4412 domain-containing protein [Mucilaginibacter psychrotolerans]|uniref:DUF4412 domain-containing protein n=1 Tax=Mucilaginibacter psychrotolerans TaxID=1524096 RepID=A0A4Y8S7U2_9SPHI|nr:DUF4412 domain-containing protein [Mucilaginibacter psychrotolerans]TFF34675.1 DUF4412 domain-containing protein [Mucilaginibacter psychrotolerans]